jgi:molecular chaperone HtpG
MSIGMGIRLLETLTSALYEDPIVLFREYVQNAVDSFNNNPVENPRIDITICENKRTITVYDNGNGIDCGDFQNKMTSIGKSEKANVINQIGFRGIGRLSAMPFCDSLVFKNKVEGEAIIQYFSWDGKRYNELLSKAEEDDLESAIRAITQYKIEESIQPDEHYFCVELINYSDEIDRLIHSNSFEESLRKLLPLKYSPAFPARDIIHELYQDYMGKSLEQYEFDIFLNNKQLFKLYDKSSVLESNVVVWHLSFNASDDDGDDRIGILWFSFNRKVSANPKGSPRGIYVRSKNMQMGNEYALANAVSNANSEYVATYRELTQTLNGVFGELLIDTQNLSDNARRDWFRIDQYSLQLGVIISDFLKKLKEYRYAASQAFNDTSNQNKRERVITAFVNLTRGLDQKLFEEEFYSLVEKGDYKTAFLYANDDIPRLSVQNKRLYESIILLIKNYCIENYGEKGMNEFIRIRTYIKRELNNGEDE